MKMEIGPVEPMTWLDRLFKRAVGDEDERVSEVKGILGEVVSDGSSR